MGVPAGALAAVLDVVFGLAVDRVPGDCECLAEQPEWDGPLDGLLDAVARLSDAGDLFCVLDAYLDRPALPGFKRSLQHLDEKELRWRCASEGQIGLLER